MKLSISYTRKPLRFWLQGLGQRRSLVLHAILKGYRLIIAFHHLHWFLSAELSSFLFACGCFSRITCSYGLYRVLDSCADDSRPNDIGGSLEVVPRNALLSILISRTTRKAATNNPKSTTRTRGTKAPNNTWPSWSSPMVLLCSHVITTPSRLTISQTFNLPHQMVILQKSYVCRRPSDNDAL